MACSEKPKCPAAVSQSPQREPDSASVFVEGTAGSDHWLVYREKIMKKCKSPLDKRGDVLYYIQARVLAQTAMKQEIAASKPVTSAEYVR